jgi:hypothetical protein
VPFREDILRGVRLSAIAFAAILLGVAAYRMLHMPAAAQTAPPEAVQPAPDPSSPDQEALAQPVEPEVHPLIVPPPPPVAGTVVKKVARPRAKVTAEPLAARVNRAPVTAGKEFEPAEAGLLPAAPVDESTEAGSAPVKKGVG